jgi:hypothetical protein
MAGPVGWPEAVAPIFQRRHGGVRQLRPGGGADHGADHPYLEQDAPVVLVQGLATVRDADLQANTDRYVRVALAKAPEMFRGTPRFLLRRLDFYFARIWIQVTPIRLCWWPSTALDQAPGR